MGIGDEEEPSVMVPLRILRNVARSINNLTEIIEENIDLPEGGCNCAAISIPPCSFCENGGHMTLDVARAGHDAHEIRVFLDKAQTPTPAEVETEGDMQGFGSF